MKKRGRKRSNLATALADVATPVFAIDSARRIVFFNAGCERLTGWSPEDLLGREVEYRSDEADDVVSSFANAVCPPPEVFDGERRRSAVYLPVKSGTAVPREVQFVPLLEEDGTVSMVLGLVGPLPESAPNATRESGVTAVHAELASLRLALRRRYGRDSLLGRSPAGRRMLEQVDLACRGTGSVLFVGETGSGRSHAARVVHASGGAPNRVLVPLDCERLDPGELRRTLRKLFRGDTPTTGTGLSPTAVLLENVHATPREVQQLVCESLATPTGTQVRLRLFATTTPSELQSADFLEEFGYHLTTQRVDVPSLRERREDLEPLATAFLEATNRGATRQVSGFDEAAWDELRRHHWPGNVAELRSVVQAAREACESNRISVEHLPFRFHAGRDARKVGPVRTARPRPLDPLLAEVETEQIRLALSEARGNKSRAAELLSITRARLYRRVEQLGLDETNETAPPPGTE